MTMHVEPKHIATGAVMTVLLALAGGCGRHGPAARADGAGCVGWQIA